MGFQCEQRGRWCFVVQTVESCQVSELMNDLTITTPFQMQPGLELTASGLQDHRPCYTIDMDIKTSVFISFTLFPTGAQQGNCVKKQLFLLSKSVKQEYAGLSPSLVPVIPIKILFRDSDMRTSTKEATFFFWSLTFSPTEIEKNYSLNFLLKKKNKSEWQHCLQYSYCKPLLPTCYFILKK